MHILPGTRRRPSLRHRDHSGRRVGGAYEAVPLLQVLDKVLAFKGYQGEFVKRRMRRFLTQEAPLLGWHHDDDVSLAAIHVDAEERP